MGEIEGYDTLYRSGFLGHGSYGSVYKTRSKETGRIFAIKRVTISSADFESKLKSVRNEVEFLKQLGDKHKNILRLIKTQEEEDGPRLYIIMLMEYCTLRDLTHYAHQYHLTIGHGVKIMHEASSGLSFMHSQDPPIIHRDIKPANILMTEENGEHVVKLADFGLARPLEGSRSVETMSNTGTELYMAPEQFDDLWFKLKAHFHKSGAQDAFALGIVFYQLLEWITMVGIECPQVTKVPIGKMMRRIGEVESEIERTILKDDITQDGHYEDKVQRLREALWRDKKLTQILETEPTKSWNPILIKDDDSEIVKTLKELTKKMMHYNPRQRCTIAEVESQLEVIIKNLPQRPGVPRLKEEFTNEKPEDEVMNMSHEDKVVNMSQKDTVMDMSQEDKVMGLSKQAANVQHETSQVASTNRPIPIDLALRIKHIPSLEKLFTHELAFLVSPHHGFSSRGVIMENMDSDKLVLLSLTEGGYSTVWEKSYPRVIGSIKSNSQQYFLDGGNIVLHVMDQTYICDNELNIQKSPLIITNNFLCGVVQGDKLLLEYSMSGLSQGYLDLFDSITFQRIHTIKLDSNQFISTASHPTTGWFAITSGTSRAMWLYTAQYKLHREVNLQFQPHWQGAVSCVGILIAIVPSTRDGIVFYNWNGEEVQRVGTQEIGLKASILGLGNGGEGQMQVSTSDNCIHLFKLTM